MTALPWVAGVAAQAPPVEKVAPGLLGFFVILALAVGTYLLWRSMNRQLRKVDFEEQPPPDGEPDQPASHPSRDSDTP